MMKLRESRKKLKKTYKRQKHHSPEFVDRISDLPDSILGLILSCLPTKNSVATSVLSKRWKFVWINVHNLDFSYDLCKEDGDEDENNENEIEYMKFVEFVDRILLLNNTGPLYKFCLFCIPCCDTSDGGSWIDSAITRNVHELSVSAKFDLPISVFSCDSLKSLDLNGCMTIPDEFEVFLPRLESLKLEDVVFNDDKAFEKLISGCPVLNYLYFAKNQDDAATTFIISSTSLRRLELCVNYCNVKLNVSSLECLWVTRSISEIYVQKNLSSLVEVDFRIDIEDEYPENSIIETVRAFDSTKDLFLSADVMQALRHTTMSPSIEFKRLVNLKIEAYRCDCTSLQNIIQNSDSLEVLTIYRQRFCKRYIGDRSKWTTLLEVPRCLSNRLKKIIVHGYRGYNDVREMMRYMLKQGRVLKIMKIYSGGLFTERTQLKWLKEISKFTRKSPACQVMFA